MLPEPPARRSKFYYYFGKIKNHFWFSQKSDTFLGKILFSPVSVPLSKCSTVGQGRSGVRFPPGPVSLGIQLCLSMCLLSFPRRSLMDQWSFRFTFPFFCMYRMRLSLFWVHFRPHCRSVDLSCISCAFVLRFRSSECTACVYHSFECTFGPTVARSVFQFHSKKGLLGALVLRPLSLGTSLMDLLLLLFCCCCCSGCCCCCCYY